MSKIVTNTSAFLPRKNHHRICREILNMPTILSVFQGVAKVLLLLLLKCVSNHCRHSSFLSFYHTIRKISLCVCNLFVSTTSESSDAFNGYSVNLLIFCYLFNKFAFLYAKCSSIGVTSCLAFSSFKNAKQSRD